MADARQRDLIAEVLRRIPRVSLSLAEDAMAQAQKCSDVDFPQRLAPQDLQSLRAGLVTVNIHADQREGILIDERFPTKGATIVNRYPIENGAAQLGIHPGSPRITVKVAGFEPQSWEFEAEPASAHAHDFKLLAVAARDTTNRR